MDISLGKAASAYNSVTNLAKASGLPGGAAAIDVSSEAQRPEFSALVSEALHRAMDAGYKAEATSAKSIVGKGNLTDLVMAMGNAELTLNTVVAIRDRVISAYQDIVKMPI